MKQDMIVTIEKMINRILEDKGEMPQHIGVDTVLLGSELPLDSLDLAALVVELDARTGSSPFAAGFIEFRTVGDLATLYSNVRA